MKGVFAFLDVPHGRAAQIVGSHHQIRFIGQVGHDEANPLEKALPEAIRSCL